MFHVKNVFLQCKGDIKVCHNDNNSLVSHDLIKLSHKGWKNVVFIDWLELPRIIKHLT